MKTARRLSYAPGRTPSPLSTADLGRTYAQPMVSHTIAHEVALAAFVSPRARQADFN